MQTHQLSWRAANGLARHPPRISPTPISLCISGRAALADGARFRELRAMFPKAHVLGCSTGGQIRNDDVDDDIAAVALRFDAPGWRSHASRCWRRHSRACGAALGRSAGRGRPRGDLRPVRRAERQRQRTRGRLTGVVGAGSR